MNIITISREFGSGGRELGKRIADILGYSYYDREIITAIAQQHNFDEKYVENLLENRFPINIPLTFGNTFTYTDPTGQQAIDLLSTQSRLLREFAAKENCVIVGRSANILLEDCNPLNIFVYADLESKIKRCRRRAPEDERLTDNDMKRKFKQIDAGRAKHQRFLSDCKWGSKEGYHLCVNTSGLEIKSIAPVVAAFAENYFKAEKAQK
ncbi:MAG: cytidylate kinase-like family protein [Clostridia bacterium]|nr:cytidylate kinase-like family protein [Clostridia bacterium]